MVSDERTLQLVGAGLLVLGLAAVACTAAMFPSRGRIKDISRANRLSWSPRGFGGRGDASPVFGLMWGTIFASQAVSAVVTIVVTLLGSDATDLYALFNGVACASAALALCAAWQPVFVIDEPWSFCVCNVAARARRGLCGRRSSIWKGLLRTYMVGDACGGFDTIVFGLAFDGCWAQPWNYYTFVQQRCQRARLRRGYLVLSSRSRMRRMHRKRPLRNATLRGPDRPHVPLHPQHIC